MKLLMSRASTALGFSKASRSNRSIAGRSSGDAAVSRSSNIENAFISGLRQRQSNEKVFAQFALFRVPMNCKIRQPLWDHKVSLSIAEPLECVRE